MNNAMRGPEMHVYLKLRKRLIGTIDRDDMLESLKVLDAAGKHVYVRRVRMRAPLVFDWAAENREAESNPARKMRPEKAFGKSEPKNFAFLPLTDGWYCPFW